MRFFIVLFSLLSLLLAQSYEEYLRSQEKAFSAYKEERDRAFSDFLKKGWREYKQSQGNVGYEDKKPTKIPVAKPQDVKPPVIDTKKTTPPVKKIIIKKQPPKLTPPPKKVEAIIIPPVDPTQPSVAFTYFGVQLNVHFDDSMLFSMQEHISKKSIAKGWEELASSEYATTIKEIQTISKKLRLNDWANYLLIRDISNEIYKNDNEAKLFTWFSMLKMGYDTRLAYQKNRVIILLPIKGTLYNTVSYTLGKKQYYPIDYYAQGKIGSIMSYEGKYEGAKKPIDFALKELPLFGDEIVKKTFSFTVNAELKKVELSYNKELMKFFQSYPQVDYENYFSAPEALALQESIRKAFEPIIVGKSEQEALDIILNFVQNAFEYKVDDAQFNMEKVMFPSETLFYPYSDCEDRSILFAYMVRILLGIEVVGVKYPNHMATAVKPKMNIDGDHVEYKREEFLVSDPTYINARAGMSMPQFKNSKSYEIVSTGGEK